MTLKLKQFHFFPKINSSKQCPTLFFTLSVLFVSLNSHSKAEIELFKMDERFGKKNVPTKITFY